MAIQPMVTRVRKWGNSLGVRLPKAAADEARVRDGSAVDVRVEEGEIVMRPVRRPRYRLSDLLKGFTRRNRHPEADWGPPRGREAW